MPRPIWKGSITFGLVTVPVGLYSAEERAEQLSFHMLHKKDGARIEMKRFCSQEQVEVPWPEIEKGYEYEKGRHVVISEEDFDKARIPATQSFEIRAFVDATEVGDLYFDQPYYLAPEGKASPKAYALLRDALKQTGKIGIGTIVLRQREHLAALEPVGEALVLTTMRFAHELRTPADLALPREGEGWNDKEMKLAHQLIDTLATVWDPTEYKDTYTDVLKQVIQQKIEGKEITAPKAERRAEVIDLAKALEESLKTPRKAPARAAGRREPAARAVEAAKPAKRARGRKAG